MPLAPTSAAIRLLLAATAVAALSAAWIISEKAANDFVVSIVAGAVGVLFVIKVLVLRFKVGWTTWFSLAAFLALNLLISWDVRLARNRASSLMETIKVASHECRNTACLLEKAAVQADSKYTNAILFPVRGIGANMYVRLSAHAGKCSLWTDYLLGGEKGITWACRLKDT